MTARVDLERIYLDHAATSPMRPEVWSAMEAELEHCFNPASTHAFGRRAHRCLEMARGHLAELLDCDRAELYFTAGGTASDNLAILGFTRAHRDRTSRVLVSEVEHKAVLEAARVSGKEGARVGHDGSPTLISVMWANNEVGTIQPIRDLAEIAHEHGALLHTDAVQAVGKVDVSLAATPADLFTATAHKLGGPVGIGLLFCRRGTRLEPIMFGGEQERSLWPGTQNPIWATGFAEAFRLVVQAREGAVARWRQLRDHLEARARAEIPGIVVHGGGAPERLASLSSLGIPDCDSGALRVSLDLDGVAISGGSACSSDTEVGSSVLQAMGVEGGDAYATIRFSFGHATTREEVDRAADILARVASRLLALGS
jgi:cysteine desulfurase